MTEVLLGRDNIDTARMRVSPSATTKELQDMYQRLQEMIWARTYRSKIEDQLKDMPHTKLPGAPKFLFDSIESKIIRPVPLHHDDGQTPHLIHIIIIIITDHPCCSYCRRGVRHFPYTH
jgi:hypothetical protein